MINAIEEASGEGWHIWNGDCVEVMAGLPGESVDMSVFSRIVTGKQIGRAHV